MGKLFPFIHYCFVYLYIYEGACDSSLPYLAEWYFLFCFVLFLTLFKISKKINKKKLIIYNYGVVYVGSKNNKKDRLNGRGWNFLINNKKKD